MKNKVIMLLWVSVILSMLISPLILSAENATADITVDTSNDIDSKVEKAYTCLTNSIDEKTCTSLSFEEKVFSLLAVDKCESQILSEAKNGECWPSSGCKLKSTAQAILALSNTGSETTKAESWLIAQNMTATDLDWFLEIESPEATSCKITYSGATYTILIGEDKKINTGAGTCLSLSEGRWWLKVSSTCFNQDIDVSCDKQFLTTLLYKKKTSSTIYVSEKATSGSAEGTTTERVSSYCFKQGSACDYEGSLWATLILNHLNYDITPYLPYLITMEEDNQKYLPQVFLYLVTSHSDYRNELLLKQKDKYWEESGDKFFDTALALYAFQYEEPIEKTESINWLLEVQGKDGCWQSNIRNTAFILYSVWPKSFYTPVDDPDASIDCTDAGYFCMSQMNCEGSILDAYSCSGVSKCCDKEFTLDLCADQGGEICNSNQECLAGSIVDSSDTKYGEVCCVSGRCDVPTEPVESDCVVYGGICRPNGCDDGEESTSDDCSFSTDSCCVKPTVTEEKKSYLWIWILLILILLVILALIFKDKLRPYWYQLKSKFSKTKPEEPKQGLPRMMPPSRMPFRAPPRRMLPPPQSRPPVSGQRPQIANGQRPPLKRMPPAPQNKPSGEVDEVLKKLKEMGK